MESCDSLRSTAHLRFITHLLRIATFRYNFPRIIYIVCLVREQLKPSLQERIVLWSRGPCRRTTVYKRDWVDPHITSIHQFFLSTGESTSIS